jgi:hypothetical protein
VHVQRLIAFLEKISGLDQGQQDLVAAAIELVRAGKVPEADWLTIANNHRGQWDEIGKALAG